VKRQVSPEPVSKGTLVLQSHREDSLYLIVTDILLQEGNIVIWAATPTRGDYRLNASHSIFSLHDPDGKEICCGPFNWDKEVWTNDGILTVVLPLHLDLEFGQETF